MGYFYELSQPIISMEIVFVLIMIVVLLIMVLQDPYNGQVELFLFAMILHSNVLMMLIMMAFLVIVFVFMHLFRLLLVYKEQKMHEKWVQGMIRKFQIEEANMLDRLTNPDVSEEMRKSYSSYVASLKNTRDLLNTMHSDMIENRAAPQILGGIVNLNDTLIQTIMGSIVTALTAAVFSVFHGLVLEHVTEE